jgi:hypothetical protein
MAVKNEAVDHCRRRTGSVEEGVEELSLVSEQNLMAQLVLEIVPEDSISLGQRIDTKAVYIMNP